MCLVKKPKVAAPAPEKEAAILRNPYLDGLDPILRARSGGVRSLTIRRDQNPSVMPPRTPSPPIQVPSAGGPKYPNQGSLSDHDYERAVKASYLPGVIGIWGRSTLSKAQK